MAQPDITTLYFIRHGESQANAEGVIAGGYDSPLTERGIHQARSVAAVITDRGITLDAILSSSLSRAYDTAVIIAEANGYPASKIIIIDELCEKRAGSFECGPLEAFYAASNEELQRAGAEASDVFAARVGRANSKITRFAKGITLIVGHAGFYRMAECMRQGLPPAEMVRIAKPANGILMEYPL